MRRSLLTIFLLSLSGSLMAQETSVLSSETSLIERSENKRYLGLSIWNHVGKIGVGFKYGHFLTQSNLADLSFTQWSNAETGSLENVSGKIKSNVKGFSIANKYFLGNSFNIGAGIYYRDVQVTLPNDVKIISQGVEVKDRNFTDIGGPSLLEITGLESVGHLMLIGFHILQEFLSSKKFQA